MLPLILTLLVLPFLIISFFKLLLLQFIQHVVRVVFLFIEFLKEHLGLIELLRRHSIITVFFIIVTVYSEILAFGSIPEVFMMVIGAFQVAER